MSPRSGGSGLRCMRWTQATLRPARRRRCTAASIGGPRRAPAERRSSVGVLVALDLDRRDVGGDRGDLGGPQVDHPLVVLRRVGDVAGAVLLLDAADAVHQPRRAGDRPRPGERVGVAEVRPELGVAVGVDVVELGGERHRDVGQAVDVGQLPRLGAVGEVAVGQQDHRRAVLDGDARPPRSRPRSSAPGCTRRRPAAAPRRERPNSAMLRSAASVLVGRPVDGPPRWMSTISSGSSTRHGEARSSRSSAPAPGPLVVVTPRWPAKAAPRAMPAAAISSSACTVRTPKCLCLDSSWRMSEAGVIG